MRARDSMESQCDPATEVQPGGTNDYKSYSICTSLVATNGVPLTGEGGLIRDEAIIHISRNMAAKNGNPRRHVTAGLTEVYRWGHTWDPLPEWWRGV